MEIIKRSEYDDVFYSETNMKVLARRIEDIESCKNASEHALIEEESEE